MIHRCDGLFSSLPELSASPSSSNTTNNKRLRVMVESRATAGSGAGYWPLDKYFSGLGALGQVGSEVLENPPDVGDHQYKVRGKEV